MDAVLPSKGVSFARCLTVNAVIAPAIYSGAAYSESIVTVDVPAAFDNCFFNSYAIYLYVNNKNLPADLFTFTSILGESGQQFPLPLEALTWKGL